MLPGSEQGIYPYITALAAIVLANPKPATDPGFEETKTTWLELLPEMPQFIWPIKPHDIRLRFRFEILL